MLIYSVSQKECYFICIQKFTIRNENIRLPWYVMASNVFVIVYLSVQPFVERFAVDIAKSKLVSFVAENAYFYFMKYGFPLYQCNMVPLHNTTRTLTLYFNKIINIKHRVVC